MKNLNVEKFKIKKNYITTKEDYTNKNNLFKIVFNPEEFLKDNSEKIKIFGSVDISYQQYKLTVKYFKHELGCDFRTELYSYLKYEDLDFFYDDEEIKNKNKILEVLEIIKPLYFTIK